MSRIGKVPVAIPSGVTADIENGTLSREGPQGHALAAAWPRTSPTTSKDGAISVKPANDSKRARAFHLGHAAHAGLEPGRPA